MFKSGLPATVAKYNTLPDPKPLLVGIGWVVECVERRQKVDETRFTIAVQDLIVGTGGKASVPYPDNQPLLS